MTKEVAFVGPLPPPVHGFSNICAMMLDLLKARMLLYVFDRAPKGSNRFLTILQQLGRSLRYFLVCLRRRNVMLYLALSGGSGQIIDCIYVLVSKLFGRPVFVHHHSFSYINAPSLLNRCLFALIRDDTHIVLSRDMGAALTGLYDLNAARVRVISNAAFYDAADSNMRVPNDTSAPIQIGFLSNITFEKGFVEFFGILTALKQRGIEYRAHIAGPLALVARQTFSELLASASDVEYLGPIYGETKERFYNQLDIFVFPTKYVNEAEPLVIYEAMRRAVHVIACDRGAISEMLDNGAGLVVTLDDVVESAVMHISKFASDRSALTHAQQLSLQQARRIRSSSGVQLDCLLSYMQGAT
jgi:glycosyltransferase involved in cell wall biosynthesis